MLNTSQDVFWIALALSIVVVSTCLAVVLIRLSGILKEGEKTVQDVNKKLEMTNPVLEESTRTVSSLMQTLQTIDQSFLNPAVKLGVALKGISNIFSKNK